MNQHLKICMLFLTASLILTGCEQKTKEMNWTLQAERKPRLIVLNFLKTQQKLSAHNKMQLAIAKETLLSKSQIYAEITVPVNLNMLMKNRIKDLKKYLKSLYIPHQNIKIIATLKISDSETILINLFQYEMIPPLCPGWTVPMTHVFGINTGPQGEENFKCRNVSNLSQMIAEPRDIVSPEPLGKGDGAYFAKTVENLRNIKSDDANNKKADIGAANSGTK